jgi:MraZ protein
MSSATEVEPDKQGRILLPQKLRTHAHIEKNVVLLGVGARIEIWDPETYENDGISDDMNEIAEELLGNGFEI